MPTAFVLSGGGNLGAVQVGMLLALADRGVVPDVLVGTSVGAVNAAFLAAGPSPARVEDLAEVWKGISRRDVFPTSPRAAVRALAGRTNSFVDPSGLRALLQRSLTFEGSKRRHGPWPSSPPMSRPESRSSCGTGQSSTPSWRAPRSRPSSR